MIMNEGGEVPLFEAFGFKQLKHANGAELEALRTDDLAMVGNRELHTSAADVDQQNNTLGKINAIGDGRKDQTTFFDTVNDVDTDSTTGSHFFDEVIAVGGLTHRTRGHGFEVLDSGISEDCAKFLKCFDGFRASGFGELAFGENVGTEANWLTNFAHDLDFAV